MAIFVSRAVSICFRCAIDRRGRRRALGGKNQIKREESASFSVPLRGRGRMKAAPGGPNTKKRMGGARWLTPDVAWDELSVAH